MYVSPFRPFRPVSSPPGPSVRLTRFVRLSASFRSIRYTRPVHPSMFFRPIRSIRPSGLSMQGKLRATLTIYLSETQMAT